jgi:CubicO group peptidase (beta-lactamase class C family)
VWEPDTAHGYHALTFGWLLNALVSRATGESIGAHVRDLIAGPVGLGFFLGLPASEIDRVSALEPGAPPSPTFLDDIHDPELKALVLRRVTAAMDPSSLMSRALSTGGVLPTPDATVWSTLPIYSAEIPAANGITNARSLARMYSACLGTADGVRLITEETLNAACEQRSAGRDQVLLGESRFGSGFMLHSASSPFLGDQSFGHFGHFGAGGAVAFADREHRTALGYVPNRLSSDPTGDPGGNASWTRCGPV